PERRLFVEEACSGIYSLFVGLTATLFYVLWVRRGWLMSLLLFGAAIAWVMVCNVVRIVTTAVLWYRWGLDINSGWKHEVFGLLIVVLPVGLIFSTDCLFESMFGAVRRFWSEQVAWRCGAAWQAIRLRFARKGARPGNGSTAIGGGGLGNRAASARPDRPD